VQPRTTHHTVVITVSDDNTLRFNSLGRLSSDHLNVVKFTTASVAIIHQAEYLYLLKLVQH